MVSTVPPARTAPAHDVTARDVTAADVAAAAARVAPYVRRTPVVAVDVPGDGDGAGRPVLLKLESLQHTGSFKARGAVHRVLTAPDAAARGVIAASGGNHGLAVGYAARRLGVPVEIFVPEVAAPVKLGTLRAQGIPVTVAGGHYADAYDAMRRRAEQTGAVVVHAYDDAAVVAGQGTLALELLAQAGPQAAGPAPDPAREPAIDTVLVAVGGGGLLAGVAAALGDRVRVVAVEPEQIPTLHDALAAGAPVDVPVSGIAADSLGARRIGGLAFAGARRYGVRSLLVPDEAIAAARRWLWTHVRVVAEAGGATALAALLAGAYAPRPGERVAVIVCGGNTDPTDLAERA